jgi:hypothetical protein
MLEKIAGFLLGILDLALATQLPDTVMMAGSVEEVEEVEEVDGMLKATRAVGKVASALRMAEEVVMGFSPMELWYPTQVLGVRAPGWAGRCSTTVALSRSITARSPTTGPTAVRERTPVRDWAAGCST